MSMIPSVSRAASTETLTVESLLKEVEENNPAVRAARERWQGALEIPKSARALPNPRASFDVPLQSVETRGGPIQGKASVSQAIPFPGKRGLVGKVASLEARVAQQGYRAAVLAMRSHAANLALDLYHHRRAVEIFDQQIELLRHFSRVAEKKYGAGRGTQAAAFRAQAELSVLENRRTKMRYNIRAEELRLNSLLGRREGTFVPPIEFQHGKALSGDREELKGRALKTRPELLAAMALEEVGEAKRRLALKRYFPDFLIGYETTRIGSGGSSSNFDGRDAHSIRLGITLPFWRGANRARSSAAQREESAATLEVEDLSRRTLSEVSELFERGLMLLEVTTRHGDVVLPQFRSVLAAAQRGYESDSVSFEFLLDAERDLLDQEIFHVRHHVELAKLGPLMERLIGGSL